MGRCFLKTDYSARARPKAGGYRTPSISNTDKRLNHTCWKHTTILQICTLTEIQSIWAPSKRNYVTHHWTDSILRVTYANINVCLSLWSFYWSFIFRRAKKNVNLIFIYFISRNSRQSFGRKKDSTYQCEFLILLVLLQKLSWYIWCIQLWPNDYGAQKTYFWLAYHFT